MGVFKKLTGADVRVTPIRVKFPANDSSADVTGTASTSKINFNGVGGVLDPYYLHKSIRQLYYGAFFKADYAGAQGSLFYNGAGNGIIIKDGTFSRYDPSFQGSGTYHRDLGNTIKVKSIRSIFFGESIVPGSISGGVRDDLKGNLYTMASQNNDVVVGNVFYDQGILVRTDGNSIGNINYSGSYTIYATQYKCTADPDEFNYTLNPTILSGSEYDPSIVESADFMPYVTTRINDGS